MTVDRDKTGPEVNWEKELGYEVQGQPYVYMLPNDPKVVGRMVTAGVYKLLSGHDVSDREVGRFIDGSSIIKDEQTEVVVKDLFDQLRYKLSESTGYKQEWEEATEKGQNAILWLQRKNDYDFVASYDYWQLRPIKSGIYLTSDKNDRTAVRLRAPLAEIASVRGFPGQLLSREIDSRRLEELGLDSELMLRRIAGRLGLKCDEIIQKMFDDELNMCFVKAMNDCGHTKFDKARAAIVDIGESGHVVLTAAQQWAFLSKEERAAAQIHKHERLTAQLVHSLTKGQTGARLVFNYWADGEVWFDPMTMRMAGKLVPVRRDTFYASLYPELSRKTTNMELLDIRNEAVRITNELGFPQPNRW